MVRTLAALGGVAISLMTALACQGEAPPWERANPIAPVPAPPLGIDSSLTDLPDPPTPARVRLGRWLFYDKRLSADGTIACATCHRPEHAFSEPTAVSTGLRGQKGGRKAPSFINQAWTIYPHFFWDGRAASLEEQALGPVANSIEMGNTHEAMVATLTRTSEYAPYFREAFGTPEITKERVAKAIADYERTQLSGNSPWDRWQKNRDETAVSEEVKKGHELFFGKAACNQCHLGQKFTDSLFHNGTCGLTERTSRTTLLNPALVLFTAALVGFHRRQREQSGLLGRTGLVVGLLGLMMILLGNIWPSPRAWLCSGSRSSSFGHGQPAPHLAGRTRRGRCSTDGTAEVVDALAKLHDPQVTMATTNDLRN